jgi:soluble lytic murein transglycosylase-like protein
MAWCKNAVAEEVIVARQRAAAEAAQREASGSEGLPAMAPAQVSPAPDAGSTGPRGFASPAPQQEQATAAPGGVGTQQAYGAAAYTPPVDQQQQFYAYIRLAKAMNSKLSDHEALRIAQSIFKYCDYYQVSRPLVASMIYAESMYNPIAKSSKGALGLCQLMPATAKAMGISYPYDIEWNIYGGVQYLRAQLDRYAAHPNNERFARAMSAYNAGAGAVEKYGGIPPYRETQNFVRKVANKFNELWNAGYR